MSLTIYRAKRGGHDFRVVSGNHAPLSLEAYTRSEYADAREAYASRSTSEPERVAILRIDPNAASAGSWVRTDKGDGERSTVTRDDVVAAIAVDLPNADVGAILKAVMKAERATTTLGREKSTKLARFDFELRT